MCRLDCSPLVCRGATSGYACGYMLLQEPQESHHPNRPYSRCQPVPQVQIHPMSRVINSRRRCFAHCLVACVGFFPIHHRPPSAPTLDCRRPQVLGQLQAQKRPHLPELFLSPPVHCGAQQTLKYVYLSALASAHLVFGYCVTFIAHHWNVEGPRIT